MDEEANTDMAKKKQTKKAGKKTPQKKAPSAKPPAKKPEPQLDPVDPHAQAARTMFKEVRTLHDIVGRTATMLWPDAKPPTKVKVVNVDLSAGVYLLRLKKEKGIFVFPIDSVQLQVL